MTDNIAITAGSGTTVATDETGGIHFQKVKLIDGTADSTTAIPGDAAGLRIKGQGFSVQATLTVTNGAYSVSDVVGGLITFANAVSANGKHSIINTIVLAGVVAIPYELWFFNADLTTPLSDNAAFAIVAGDTDNVLGIVPISAIDYCAAQSAFNVATIRGVGLQVKAGASTTSIYAYMKATATTSPGTTTLYLTITGEYVD